MIILLCVGKYTCVLDDPTVNMYKHCSFAYQMPVKLTSVGLLITFAAFHTQKYCSVTTSLPHYYNKTVIVLGIVLVDKYL